MADPITGNADGSEDQKNQNSDQKEPMDWHTCLAAFLDVRWPQADPNTPFDILQEIKIGTQPVRTDFVFHKKDAGLTIKDPIVSSFREYQILEFKGPKDSLNTRTLSKGVGYAALYAEAKSIDILRGKIGITFLRRAKPVCLFKTFREVGIPYQRTAKGVYEVSLASWLPVQIVVMREVDDQNWGFLRLLTNELRQADYEVFINFSNGLSEEQKRAITFWVQRCIDENPGFIMNHGIEGVNSMFSDYVKAQVDAEVKAKVDAEVKAQRAQSDARENTMLRQILKMILGDVREYHMSFDKAMAKADLSADLEAKVRNLYAAGAQ